jgi:response regulator of citrate/malate metabolism
LDKYIENNSYDIVISDINMPILNGIDMITQIKEIDIEQVVIVTSAHDESEYLMKLIDIGVDNFILKPVELQKLINTLYKSCKIISDKKLLTLYRDKLEESNLELEAKNKDSERKSKELERINRVLELKLTQNCEKVEALKQKNIQTMHISDEPKFEANTEENPHNENYMEYMIDLDIEELEDLEGDIDGVTALISLNHRVSIENLKLIGQYLLKYGSILASYPMFYTLGISIITFAKEVDKLESISDDINNFATMYLESFVFTLSKWRYELFEKGVNNPNVYDASMINDIMMLVNILNGSSEEIDGDIELF